MENEVIRGATAFMIVYIMLYSVSLFLLVIAENCDLVTGFTAVAATINNIGPGLGEVGPMGSFAGFTHFTKLLLSFDMLAGRLEIFPMIMLLSPATWKHR